jgi:Peptidase MA superfamily
MRNPIGPLLALALFIFGYSVAPQNAIAQCKCGTLCTCPDSPHVGRSYRQGCWFILETDNFQVCCEQSEAPAADLARHVESLRNVLCATWLGKNSPDEWNPKCQVILYSSRQSYVRAAGRGSERTVGSSLVKTNKGRIVSRRIDLLGAGTEFLSAALPHELTHVVLRDQFTSTVAPRWADEGMAMLADTEAKQGRHYRDLEKALAQRTTFHAAELLTMEEYPPLSRFGVFYGQSASLTKFLVARKSAQQFVEFLDRARNTGYDAALQECYGIAGVGELDRQWRQGGYLARPVSYDEMIHSVTQSSSAKPPLSLPNSSVPDRLSGK